MILFRKFELFRRTHVSFLDMIRYPVLVVKCPAGCLIIEVGPIGLTILRGECISPKWFTFNLNINEDDLP